MVCSKYLQPFISKKFDSYFAVFFLLLKGKFNQDSQSLKEKGEKTHTIKLHFNNQIKLRKINQNLT